MVIAHRKIIAFALIVLALVIWAGGFLKNQRPSPVLYNDFPAQARVETVIDGDTIILAGGEKVRYLGINAPEIMVRERNQWKSKAQIYGKEARAYNQRLVEGKNVRLEYDQKKRDDYNRILAYVWSDETLVNGELIRNGLALVDVRSPNNNHHKLFFDYQKEAREFRRGLWNKIDAHTLPAKEASELIGEIGVVQGKILSVVEGREKVYLHFGNEWEKDFTGIIYRDILQSFPWKRKELTGFFSGRNVKIYGVVKNNEGPAIIISAPSQVEILN